MEFEEQKKAGGVAGTLGMSSLVNYNSVRLFQKTAFYRDALNAAEYLTRQEGKVMGWLNVVLIKEFMTVRIEIDLNYIDLHPSNIETLGW